MADETEPIRAENARLRAELAREKKRMDACRQEGAALQSRFAEEKMDFILSFSHELRSPLMKVLAYIETLQRPDMCSPEKSAAYLKVMHRHVLSMSCLIEELFNECYLDVEQTYHMVNINTNRVFTHYCEELALYAENAERAFKYSITPHLPPVRLDTGRFAQVMSNLVENAVKFTPSDGGHIFVRVDAQRCRLRVRIYDNGRGIPKEGQAHIFDRFYTSSTTTPARRSSGLGLSIVRAIVQKHGGSIRVRSALNRGTLFLVTLPLAVPDDASPKA